MEASGTSGMKAAINGVVNCSILDGWWAEAWDGVNGWAIEGNDYYTEDEDRDNFESQQLFNVLENEIIPCFYERVGGELPTRWIARMKASIATGLGFACEKGNELVGALLKDYDDISFLRPDGTYDMTPCPDRNALTLKQLGMDMENQDQIFMGIRMLPEDYLCPMKYYTGKKKITKNTSSIHHFCASWITPTAKRTLFLKRIFGVKLYDKLYGKFLHKFKWLEW